MIATKCSTGTQCFEQKRNSRFFLNLKISMKIEILENVERILEILKTINNEETVKPGRIDKIIWFQSSKRLRSISKNFCD